MQIGLGDRLPAGTLHTLELAAGACAGPPARLETAQVFAGKTVVVVAVPGAYTPTCSERHLPAFLGHYEAFRARGVDTLAVLSTNDAWVLAHWARDLGSAGRLLMLADGSAAFTRDLGLLQDLSAAGLGLRSQRFAMVVRDGVVKYLGVDAGPVMASSAEAVLAHLQ